MESGGGWQYPWWGAGADNDPDAARKRAIAWLDDPFPTMWAQARGLDATRLLDAVRRSIEEYGVEPWESPQELETWLRGLLQGCATTSGLAQGRS